MVGMTLLPARAEEKTIAMGTLSWEDLTPITGITKKVLEDAGYTVKVTEFSEWGIAYAALAKGDIQMLASQSDSVAQDYWDKNKKRLEKISPVSWGLNQNIAVPSCVKVDSIDELNANADTFGGKIIGIEPGSGLMRDTANAVKAYDLKLQLVEGSTAAMTAALKSAIALAIASPVGVLAGFAPKLDHVIEPMLDLVQTLPPYIYLLPAIALLGYGLATALVATVIVAIPPALRLTALGIRMTPNEFVELGQATGITGWQMVYKIRLPFAMPSIMAGIVGSGGLGETIYKAIRTLDIAKSIDAAIAIVILTIILDRLTQSAARSSRKVIQ